MDFPGGVLGVEAFTDLSGGPPTRAVHDPLTFAAGPPDAAPYLDILGENKGVLREELRKTCRGHKDLFSGSGPDTGRIPAGNLLAGAAFVSAISRVCGGDEAPGRI
ncbi:MAG: hypothetical protein LBO05_00115 [Deltaproteobacteria bacterium]|nr:hypothetical protein [Deltaproteobacteria bacterium]